MHPFLAFLCDLLVYLFLCICTPILFMMSKPALLCQECHSRVYDGYSAALEHVHRPPPPPPTEFEYERLPDKRRSMRLLNLFSSSPENPQIECKLIVVDIDPKKLTKGSIGKEYEALSWCWGTAHPTSYINIRKNGRIYSKKVQPDLVAALKALRHPQEDRYLWIDAICINQADVGEKNHQVEMMSTIYGQAKSVCVWLGEGDATSAMAFKFIQKEVLQLQNFDELCDSKEASKKWGALLDLMQRQWFSRRWVVQEIALAREAVIYCGADKIPWKDFAVAVELFVEVETATHRLSEVMKKDPQFYHVPGWFEYVSALGASLLVEATGKLFRDTKSTAAAEHDRKDEKDRLVAERAGRQPLLSLEYLVSSLSIFDVSVEHDTIYALLAIAKDTTPSASDSELTMEPTRILTQEPTTPVRKPYNKGSELLLDRTKSALEDFTQRKRYTVAYESTYVDACKTFIQFCIWQSDPTRALDIICRPWAAEDKKSANEKNFFYENRPMPKEVNMSLPSWVPTLSGAPYAMYAHAGVHTLKMGRKNADTLVGLPTALQRNYNAAETRGIDKKTLRFKKRIKHNMHFSMYVKGFVLDTVEQVYPASQGGAIPQEWIDAVGWENVDRSDPPDEFWRTLVADRGRDGRNPPVYYSRACKESFLKGGLPSGSVSTSDLINNERCSVVAQFCRRVQAVVWNRCLIKTKSTKTKSDNIGLASKNVQRGDLVCILYGCSVPVILRRCENKKTALELAQEREEDFINTVRDVQRRWKRKFERNRRARMTRISRLLVKLMRKKGTELVDPIVRFYITRKYGTRWRRIAKASTAARREQERLLGEGGGKELERTPGTSEDSESLEPSSDGLEKSEAQGEGLPAADGRKTPPPKSPGPPSPRTPRSIPLPQTPGAPPPSDAAEKERAKEEIARVWEEKFRAWLAEVPKDEEDERWVYYQFLGEAYVHGMMDGEAMEYQNTQEIKTSLFELR